MEQFIRITGIAAPLLRANIDTDLLIPSRDIQTPGKEGLGAALLAPWRYLPCSGDERVEDPGFVLNREPFRRAVVLVAGENFGSGSSREAAVWALRQFGFRCVIAPSFGNIFRNNCYRNGVLPVQLPVDKVGLIAHAAELAVLELTVDLERCEVTWPGHMHAFTVPATERDMMLEGLDAIGMTLRRKADVEAFELRDRIARPWIWQRHMT